MSILMPIRLNCSGMMPRWATPAFRMVISELVMAARPMKLPTSIMSGSMRCEQPFNELTPLMVKQVGADPFNLRTH